MKPYFLLLFVVLSGFATLAQKNDDDKPNKIHAQRIAFLTDELDLSIEEAQAFWPVYNEYQKAKGKITAERDEYKNAMNRIGKLKEVECEAYADKYISLEMAEAQLAEEYHQKYKKVLSTRKLLMLYYAESKFKTYLLQQLREKKEVGD